MDRRFRRDAGVGPSPLKRGGDKSEPPFRAARSYYAGRVGLIFLFFKRQCRQSELVKIRLKQTVLDDAVFLKLYLSVSDRNVVRRV